MEKTGKLKWTHHYGEECRLDIWVNNGSVCFEDGPDFHTARAHEGQGGSQSINEFVNDPAPFVHDFPGLHDEVCLELKAAGLI